MVMGVEGMWRDTVVAIWGVIIFLDFFDALVSRKLLYWWG
jgi:hypothetical protein